MAAYKDTYYRNQKSRDKEFRIHDGEGLYMAVRPTGKKVWIFRFKLTQRGVTSWTTIGDYPGITLEDARQEGARLRALVAKGINPNIQKKADNLLAAQAQADDFKSVVYEWIAVKVKARDWNPNHQKYVRRLFERDVFPDLGEMPIKDIKTPHFLAILRPMNATKPTTARLLYQLLDNVYTYAGATVGVEFNPVTILKNAIRKPAAINAPTLGQDQLKQLMGKMLVFRGRPQTIIAARLIMLTFVRNNELRQATWDEFDFDAALWRIPADRMKMRRPHLVPLSHQAILLLKELKALSGVSPYILPKNSDPQKPMGVTTVNRLLESIGFKGQLSVHGFRGTASTVLHEQEWPSDAIESQLAHAPRNQVKAAYNHAQYLPKRRKMMQAWADWLGSIAPPEWLDTVVPVAYLESLREVAQGKRAQVKPRWLASMMKAQPADSETTDAGRQASNVSRIRRPKRTNPTPGGHV